MRLGILTDIHYGFDQGHKKGTQAPRLVDKFLKAAVKFQAGLIVSLGDLVIRKNPETDLFWLKRLSQHFNAVSIPRDGIPGNHDDWNIPRPAMEQTLGFPSNSHIRNGGDFNFIFWAPNTIAPGDGQTFLVYDEHLAWLEKTLAESSKPVLLFSHIPLDNRIGEEGFIHDGKRHFSFYDNGPEIQKILEESGKVRACFAGHQHRNRHRHIQGIHYMTLQSLVQECTVTKRTKNGRQSKEYPRGAFYILDITLNQITIRGFGRGQKNRTLDLSSAPPQPAIPALAA